VTNAASVEAGLLAKAFIQPPCVHQNHRVRQQAGSYNAIHWPAMSSPATHLVDPQCRFRQPAAVASNAVSITNAVASDIVFNNHIDEQCPFKLQRWSTNQHLQVERLSRFYPFAIRRAVST
jgi:hypothetical protein